jgi:hypothetical protein
LRSRGRRLTIFKRNSKCVGASGVAVAFSAQYVEAVESPGGPGSLTQDKTIAWIYPKERRAWREILPAVLFSNPFSNGAAFGSVNCRSDFEIGPATRRPGIPETLRRLRCGDGFVAHRATSVWRPNDPRDSCLSGPVRTSRLDGINAL